MNIQGLAVLAIVILLPISLVLNSYCSSQIKTLDYQISYDNKLTTATYDGIKSFQLNMTELVATESEDTRIRNIEAAVNTFYTSLANQLQMTGYNEEVLKDYVPAIVYNLYDGYYIYSEYKNILPGTTATDSVDKNGIDGMNFYYDRDIDPEKYADVTYKRYDENKKELLNGLKPYIYYSCRYKKGNDFDIVITYTLDSYISIQGTIDGKTLNESGYLLTGVKQSGSGYEYRGVKIVTETNLKQTVESRTGDETTGLETKEYPFRKVNGTKYYLNNNQIFAIGKNCMKTTYPTDRYSPNKITNNDSGIKYYEEAYNFKKQFNDPSSLLSKIKDLKVEDAVDENGNRYADYPDQNNNPFAGNTGKIFDELFNEGTNKKYIEDEGSVFNTHRRDVIKYSLESNLSAAIRSFNQIQADKTTSYSMPRLTDEEWDLIANNVSLITFLQGLNIGGKIYNGYAIVPNDVNEEFVSEDSIYIIDYSKNKYYKIGDPELLNNSRDNISLNMAGGYNIDFERKTVETEKERGVGVSQTDSFYPYGQLGSYTSVIDINSSNEVSEEINKLKANGGSTSLGENTARLCITAKILHSTRKRKIWNEKKQHAI